MIDKSGQSRIFDLKGQCSMVLVVDRTWPNDDDGLFTALLTTIYLALNLISHILNLLPSLALNEFGLPHVPQYVFRESNIRRLFIPLNSSLRQDLCENLPCI